MKAIIFTVLIATAFAGFLELSNEGPAGMIPTPNGYMFPECVHTVPSGSVVEEQDDGSVLAYHPETLESVTIPYNQKCVDSDPRKALKQWQDNAGYTIPSAPYLGYFSANYGVPPTPTQDGATIYYFIGSQNNDGSGSTGISIIQPVLTYSSGWQFQSWNCCPGSQTINAPAVSTHAGDSASGYVQIKDSQVTIESKNGAGQTSVLTVASAGRNFTWLDVTLETYGTSSSSCGLYPAGAWDASNFVIQDTAGNTITPSWTQPGTGECDGTVDIISPTHITITTN